MSLITCRLIEYALFYCAVVGRYIKLDSIELAFRNYKIMYRSSGIGLEPNNTIYIQTFKTYPIYMTGRFHCLACLINHIFRY